MRPAEAAVLGLLHGPAELLPVSSSGHLALARRCLGWEVDKAAEVAMHAGSALALVVGLRSEAREAVRHLDGRRIALHALAGGVPAAAGLLLERPVEERLGGARGVAAGMLAGAAALALADRAPQERRASQAGAVDGVWLGLAQAAALVPGVSRSGTTLAAARARRLRRADAARLSREVGVPVVAGAAGLKAWRVRAGGSGTRPAVLALAAAASFAGGLASLPLLGRLDGSRPLWPWAAYRAGLALLLVGRSAR